MLIEAVSRWMGLTDSESPIHWLAVQLGNLWHLYLLLSPPELIRFPRENPSSFLPREQRPGCQHSRRRHTWASCVHDKFISSPFSAQHPSSTGDTQSRGPLYYHFQEQTSVVCWCGEGTVIHLHRFREGTQESKFLIFNQVSLPYFQQYLVSWVVGVLGDERWRDSS